LLIVCGGPKRFVIQAQFIKNLDGSHTSTTEEIGFPSKCPAYVRYCFEEPMDAAIFRSRLERRSEPFRLAG
jgi:hypothetical protein